jgi:hypothetical protein
MRFMVLVPANKDSEAGVMPTHDQLAEMQKFDASARPSARCIRTR